MAENSVRSLLGTAPRRPHTGATSDEEYQAFGSGRIGTKTQIMVVFRRSDGFVEALPYASLNRIYSSDVERVIYLDFGDRVVLIEGNHLGMIFRYLVSNRCSEVVEIDERAAMRQNADDPVVARIVITCAKQAAGRVSHSREQH
jgi:hypothetical protein